ARLLVDVERQRPAHALDAALLEPRARAVDEGATDLVVVDRVEEAEEARVVLPHLEVLAVDLRGAAPDEPPVLPRGGDGDLRAVEERVLLRVEAIPELHVEVRHPRRIAVVNDMPCSNEVLEVRDLVLANLDSHARPREGAGA